MISILLPDLRGGGAERVNIDLAHEFVRAGHDVEFVLRQARGELLAEAEEHFSIYSLDCNRVRQVPLPLAGYLRDRRPDAMLAAMWPLTGVAGLGARLSGQRVKLVASEHSDFRKAKSIKAYERMALRQFGRQLYGPFHHVVAVSAGVSNSLWEVAGLPQERVTVIHNPVRPHCPGEIDAADRCRLAGWLDGEARLIAIGSLKPAKGYDVLLRALVDLRQRRDVRLLILGEGPLRNELECLAAELGIADNVWMPGFRANPGSFLQHADVFGMSSNWEGFGNVIVEALAAGVPVVSTDCFSGPSEILADGRYGRLVPVGSSAALALGIDEVLSQPREPDRLRTRALHFAPEKAAKAYLELLGGA